MAFPSLATANVGDEHVEGGIDWIVKSVGGQAKTWTRKTDTTERDLSAVADVAARDALTGLSVGEVVTVLSDDDGQPATYSVISTTDGTWANSKVERLDLDTAPVSNEWPIISSGRTPVTGAAPRLHPISRKVLDSFTFTVGDRRPSMNAREIDRVITMAEIGAITPNDSQGGREIRYNGLLLGGAAYTFWLQFRIGTSVDDLNTDVTFVIHDTHSDRTDTFGEVRYARATYV